MVHGSMADLFQVIITFYHIFPSAFYIPDRVIVEWELTLKMLVHY